MTQNIMWFSNTRARTSPKIRFNDRGEFTFNTAAQQLLPAYVAFGFDAHKKTLYLKDSSAGHGVRVNALPKTYPDLTQFMTQQKIIFPVIYCLQEQDSGMWSGTPIATSTSHLLKQIQTLAHRDPFRARSSDAMETLLCLYEPQLKSLCRSTAKTIPKEDRMQIAKEGFLDAIIQYNPNLHVFPDFVLQKTQQYLKSQIANYSGSYRECYSLEWIADGTNTRTVYADPKAERDLMHALDRCDRNCSFAKQS